MHKSFNNADNYVITDYYNENDILLIPYSQYRNEKKILQNNIHYSKLWDNKNIYI